MKRWKIVLTLAAAIGIAAMAPARASAMGMGPDGGCAMGSDKMGNPARMDSHLETMKKDLNIGAEQEEAWSTFTKAMKQQKMEMMSAMRERMQPTSGAPSTLSAPERIGDRIQLMKQRLTGMEAVAAAVKQLYGILTPQQKEVLDGRFSQGMAM